MKTIFIESVLLKIKFLNEFLIKNIIPEEIIDILTTF